MIKDLSNKRLFNLIVGCISIIISVSLASFLLKVGFIRWGIYLITTAIAVLPFIIYNEGKLRVVLSLSGGALLILQFIHDCNNAQDFKRLQTEVSIIKEYSYYSKFTVDGYERIGIMNNPTKISEMLKNVSVKLTCKETNESTGEQSCSMPEVPCSDSATAIYQTIIERYPLFPFSYAFLSFCNYKKDEYLIGDQYKEEALKILRNTSSIKGVARDHHYMKAILEDGRFINKKYEKIRVEDGDYNFPSKLSNL